MAGTAIEHRGEGAGRVKARQAEPLHGAREGDQGGGVTVGEEAVAPDRREAVFGGSHGVAKLAPPAGAAGHYARR